MTPLSLWVIVPFKSNNITFRFETGENPFSLKKVEKNQKFVGLLFNKFQR